MRIRGGRAVVILALLVSVRPAAIDAQANGAPDVRPPSSSLDSLVADALRASPLVRAAAARIDAARHRVGPAAARPDPMLMAGWVNVPLSARRQTLSASGTAMPAGPEPMTMRTFGAQQTIPWPGKLDLRRDAAEREVDAASAAADVARRQVVRDVKDAYYDVAFLDRALDIVQRNERVLGTLIQITEARYGVGTTGQQDVLKARVEATRLADAAASLREQRHAALARLNGVLDRPSETPVEGPAVPLAIVRAAAGDSVREVRFLSDALGARVADSPFPPLAELQAVAERESPELREHDAMIAAQAARVELARKSVLPDVSLSLQYGWRPGLPDMMSATVAVPVPIQHRSSQDELIAAASADLAALQAGRQVKVNAIRAEVARLVSELERGRTQLALYAKAVLPQGRAALAAATASYQVGNVEFLTVLDDQSTLFTYETEYFRALSDFARNLAELERVTGQEILR